MASFRSRGRVNASRTAFTLLLLATFSAGARVKEPRVHLAPLLEKGRTNRYRIDTQTTIEGETTSPIENNEAPKREDRTTEVEITLDVLETSSSTPAAPADSARMRVTYDLADASTTSDAYDPGADAFADAFKKLQGRSLEFTMTPGGIADVSGLENIFNDPNTAKTAKAWLRGFNYSGALPAEGIAIGQKWTRERPAENMPLRGLTWRVESTYLRNEDCMAEAPPGTDDSAAGEPAGGKAKPDTCAVILTESSLVRKGSSHGDATPDDYVRNGLRTSGTWTATGESLDSISLTTGWVVASTQTVNEQMDYEIKSMQSGSALHHTGSVKTQTHIAMLPPARPSAR